MAFKDGLFDSFDSVLVYLRQCVHNKSIYVLTKLTFYSGLKRQIPDNRPDVEVNDGLAAGDGFEEGEVIGIVMETVLAECGGAQGVLQDGEVGFPVRISV